jgi:hypothetical protein
MDSSAAYALSMRIVDIVKANTLARLRHLGVSAPVASSAAGYPRQWLNGLLGGERYTVKIGSDLIERISCALGVDHWELVRPGADMAKPRPPEWAEKSTGLEK